MVSPDGSPLQINAYQHYTDAAKGIGKEDFVDISGMTSTQVIDLLKQRGVVRNVPNQPPSAQVKPGASKADL